MARLIVAQSPMPGLRRAFDALLCYLVIDLLNGNFLLYSLKMLVLSVAVTLISSAFARSVFVPEGQVGRPKPGAILRAPR
jgi:hypothetical protein